MSSAEGPPTNDPDPINYPVPIVATLLPKAALFAALESVNELFAAFATLLLTYKLIMKYYTTYADIGNLENKGETCISIGLLHPLIAQKSSASENDLKSSRSFTTSRDLSPNRFLMHIHSPSDFLTAALDARCKSLLPDKSVLLSAMLA